MHRAFAQGRVAVVTGAASGIGQAACKKCANLGMTVCMVDITAEALGVAAEALSGQAEILPVVTDVSDGAALIALAERVRGAYGDVGVLMNNAAVRNPAGCWTGYKDWQKTMDVNLWGVVNGVQAFAPGMIAQDQASAIINTGSKQGITTPPNNRPYNVAKAAVKSYSELLQHELRNRENCQVTAHLLIPGWTTTGSAEPKPGAWLPRQVVDRMLAGVAAGDFYILCPDGETTAEMDHQRILWGAGDIIENRPPLSRWHPDYKSVFDVQTS